MGLNNSMRSCVANLICKAVCFSTEDGFVINDRKREQLLDFSDLTKTICNCQCVSLWRDVKKSTWGKKCPFLKANIISVKILRLHEQNQWC